MHPKGGDMFTAMVICSASCSSTFFTYKEQLVTVSLQEARKFTPGRLSVIEDDDTFTFFVIANKAPAPGLHRFQQCLIQGQFCIRWVNKVKQSTEEMNQIAVLNQTYTELKTRYDTLDDKVTAMQTQLSEILSLLSLEKK